MIAYWIGSTILLLLASLAAFTTLYFLYASIDRQDPEAKKFLKLEATYQVVLVISSLVGILIICAKRCEFFSIWTPLFIFVSSLSLLLLTSVISLPFDVKDHVWQGLCDLFTAVGAE